MRVSRREFMGLAAAGTIGALSIGALSGCSPNTSQAEEDDQEAGTTTKAEVPTDGVYLTKAKGHDNWIYVATTMRDGAIAACSVVRHDETIGVGNYACARIPAAIVANQSVNVPNVYGCSVSSRAIKDAVAEAITLSGYNLEDFSAEITIEQTNQTIEEDCDVVIVGAGTAGLCAGARLAEKGYKVTLVEKHDIPGGSMAFTAGGMGALGNSRKLKFDVAGSLAGTVSVDIQAKLQSRANLVGKSAEELVHHKVLYENITKVVDWWNEVGVGFMTMGSYEGVYGAGNGNTCAPGSYMGGSGYAMMFMADRITRHPDCKIIYSTKVDEILRTEEGACIGVKGTSTSGDTYTIKAKAVCLTTGSFSKNAEMVAQYYPRHAGQFFNCSTGSEGDGIKMGIEAGGVFEQIGDGTSLPAYLSSANFIELAFIGWSAPGLYVNIDGTNIGDCVEHYACGETKLDAANGDKFYYIFDDVAAEKMKKNTSMGFDTYKCLIERGDAMRYASVEACAEDLGLVNLAAEIEENNACSISGEADRFGRTGRPYIETRDGVWAVQVTPTFYLTTDGLRTDIDCRLLDSNDNAIPGLYAAGDVAGSPEKKDGVHYGYGCDSALAYGWQMAETIAAELQ